MCGRTSLFIPQDDLEQRFDARVVADGGYRPRFNIAPEEPLEVITNETTAEIDRFRWGLVPSWADDPDEMGFINARSETAHEKPAFRNAWKHRPCLVLSSGFYEWRERAAGPNQPYRIYRPDDPAFAMAGLWEEWSGDGDTIRSVTILTTEPNSLMESIHDRMPVVLPKAAEEEWLTAGPDERRGLCRPYPEDDLDAYEISRTVNNPDNDRATVIEPQESSQSGLDDFA